MNIEIIDSNGKKEINTITENYFIVTSTLKSIIHFDYDYEFLLISHEGWNFFDSNIIKFYIPEVNEARISLFIKSNANKENFNYTIIIIEENEEGEEIINKLNNPCYFIQFLDKDYNLSSEYNNMITYVSSKKDYFIYEEIDISKFKENKNLYLKILCYSENYKTILYSNAKKIFMENIVQNNNYNENDFGYDYIYDNKEYSINNNEYIFKYNIKKNHLGVMPVIFLSFYTTYNLDLLRRELEVINPLFHNMTYKLEYLSFSTQISLNNENILKDYGDYYFIFRNCLGIKFYIHNTINTFSLNNELYFYNLISSYKSTDSIMYISLKLSKKQYLHIKSYCNLYFYSITEKKIIERFQNYKIVYKSFPPDDYLILYNYENCRFSSANLFINSDHHLLQKEIPFSEEFISITTNIFYSNTKQIIFDLNSYNYTPYIIVGNPHQHLYYCSKYDNILDIIYLSTTIEYKVIEANYHLINLTSISCPVDKPYIVILFSNTIFELIKDYIIVQENEDIKIPISNETYFFNIITPDNTKKYIFAFSNNENLQDLNKTKSDRTRILFDKSNNYQFKLNHNEEIQTELKIRMIEIKEDIEFNVIKENEISDFFIINNNNITIKYYINLLKKEAYYYNNDILGETEVYLLKDEINIDTTVIEKIFCSNIIPENLFSLQKNSKLIIKPYQILALKYNSKKIVHYSYMSSLYQDFTISNPIKFIKANKKYLLKKGIKIILENYSNASIKLSSFDKKENYILNSTNNYFENLEKKFFAGI